MLSMKVMDIVKATGGILENGNPDYEVSGFCTDSRKLKGGELFVPLTGENFDGHDFIEKAVEAGACGYLTSRENMTVKAGIVIKVEDALQAFQDIAGFHRRNFDIPVVAVTGSSGKTSTKDMIYGVLAKKLNVLKTEGNLNNHIGLPMTLLNLNKDHQAAVVEMGMSGTGEIAALSRIAKPHISLITNIGLAHIGKLGSRQKILKAKMEILEGMDKDGLVILNGDDGLLYGLKDLLQHRTMFYGLQDGMDLQAYNVKVTDHMTTSFSIRINEQEYNMVIPVPGIHNVYNALAAAAVGLKFRVPVEDIIEGIRDYRPEKMRMNVVEVGKGIKLINDAYNANPSSMEEALRVLKAIPGARRIAVLGDMLELGEWTRQAHMDIGRSVVKNGINYLITLGQNSRYIAEGAASVGMSQRKINACSTIEEANNYLGGLVRSGDVILVKGSRGMKMENVVDFISGVV